MRTKVPLFTHSKNYPLVVEIILELGNQILNNLGVEGKIDDVEVFLRYAKPFIDLL